jgi:cytochrome b5
VAGQDATEAFEDVGHSDEARETLEQLKVGTLKRQVSRTDAEATQAKRPRCNNNRLISLLAAR